MSEFSWEWFSLTWLAPERLKSFQWENEWALYLIPLIPIVYAIRWLFLFKRRQKLEVAMPEGYLISDWSVWLRLLPPVLFMIAMSFLLVALARPQTTDEQVDQWTEGIDIMIVLDISESMQIQDFTPNRLEAAKQMTRDFIAGRFQDRIGLVIFSGEAVSYSPLTTDYQMLYELTDNITFNMIQKGGTAIGSSIAVAVNRMRESNTKSKVMIVMSDGENNAGSIDPITAAEIAYGFGIKIYSIAIGKEGRVPFGTDMFGRPRYIDQSLDETTLRNIAQIGEGEFFRASGNEALANIFKRIDSLEKAEIKESRYRETKDFYPIYLLFGTLFLMTWLVTKSTFMVSVLED